MKDKKLNLNKQNIETGLNINWFPGHMKKGTDELVKTSKFIDLIIEVLDARAIISSSNHEILDIFNNKPILKIALKSDYSNVTKSNDVLIGNIKQKQFKKEIINQIYNVLDDKIQSYKKKGLVCPKFSLFVIGLPNVGKSSLINFLKSKNVVQAQNRPGLTKKQNAISVNENLYLIDTPGILLKRIDDINTAYKLVLLNCIKKEIIVLEHTLQYGFNYYYNNHKNEFLKFYKLDEVNDYFDFRNKLCSKNGWILKDNQLDIQRFENNIFNDFSNGKICKINFDLAN